jgi:FKBP-type peptidyl-prolyl cis-trans isomerase
MAEGAEPLRIKTSEIAPSGLLTAVKELKKGSKAIVTLAPKYAFGDEGIPDKAVPAGATLEYEVELVDVHAVTDVTKDGGILVEVLKKVRNIC